MRILGVGAPPHVTRYQSINYTYRKLGQSGRNKMLKLSALDKLMYKTCRPHKLVISMYSIKYQLYQVSTNE